MKIKSLASQVQSWVVAVAKANVFHACFVQALCASWFIVFATQVRIPFYPIAMTLQSFSIMLVSLLATRRVSVGAVLLYLAYGAMGMPVFGQGTGGLIVLTGPCAGYYVGFVLMSLVITSLTQRYPSNGFWIRFGLVLLGNICLYIPGLCWLAYLLGWKMALQVGLFPFWLIDLTKIALVALLSVYARARYFKV